mmetsp:Transcript_15933/g.24625  ORF Transcript_15933/g.24625 Transcript_15933/m.24625 type:complete len:92 (+) Transcript_15933:177-452(+)
MIKDCCSSERLKGKKLDYVAVVINNLTENQEGTALQGAVHSETGLQSSSASLIDANDELVLRQVGRVISFLKYVGVTSIKLFDRKGHLKNH